MKSSPSRVLDATGWGRAIVTSRLQFPSAVSLTLAEYEFGGGGRPYRYSVAGSVAFNGYAEY